jgi:Zn-dependent metalloprotease
MYGPSVDGIGNEGIGDLRQVLSRPTGRKPSLHDAEVAARFYLGRLFARHGLEAIHGIAAEGPDMPGLVLESIEPETLTNTQLVRFRRAPNGVSIFGVQAVVELDNANGFVSAGANLPSDTTHMPSPTPSIAAAVAMLAIERLTECSLADLIGLPKPEIYYFLDVNGAWRLVFFFAAVPAAPFGFLDEVGQRSGSGKRYEALLPRRRFMPVNYLIDAHTGDVVFYYSAVPTARPGPLPTQLSAEDEDGQNRTFLTRHSSRGFVLHDPLRNIRTMDLASRDALDGKAKLPRRPVTVTPRKPVSAAAVSAHANAAQVYDFWESVLHRQGANGKKSPLTLVIRCGDETGEEFRNAFATEGKLWFGQVKGAHEKLRSKARHLDVIAHEFTHAITENTANLVYANESGALNESFSDIFGIMIANWAAGRFANVNDWVWELGTDFFEDGQPLRSLATPASLGDPDRMANYHHTHLDHGGVHTNCGIHNRAAYLLLRMPDEDDDRQPALSPEEVAILYYETLRRLPPLAGFKDALRGLVAVASSLWMADPTTRARKVTAIRVAYERVGIFWSG